MDNTGYVLGIDTSNYKTSVAVLNRDSIECDLRRFLEVKEGERGLRQSEALFQHVRNLPEMIEDMKKSFDGEFCGVAYSSKPRPVNDSYMPVFLAGEGTARSIAAALDVPVISFSHQEAHIQAIKSYTEMSDMEEFLACHFSGGTCEVLHVTTKDEDPPQISEGFQRIGGEGFFYDIDIVGGSLDISFGQVLDRAGVAMGFPFPAGKKMDDIAVATKRETKMLTPVRVYDGQINLSGIDTQIKNKLKALSGSGSFFSTDPQTRDELIREIFVRLSDGIAEMLRQASKKTGLKDIIMSGGVSSSRFIRSYISDELEKEDVIVYFDEDENELSTDNAVGTALLGGKYLWDALR